MSRSINKVTLVGRLGKDPEIKVSQGGMQVCKFSLATGESYTDKNGQKQESTEWHNICCFDKLADIAEKYLKKGNLIYLEGKLKTNTYEKDGEKKYFTEIIMNQLVMLGDKNQSETSFENESMPDNSNDLPPIGNRRRSAPAPKTFTDSMSDIDNSDDVPF